MRLSNIRTHFKTVTLLMPTILTRWVVHTRDWFWWHYCMIWQWTQQKNVQTQSTQNVAKNKPHVLFFALYGMRHAGTEKNLQLMANGLCENYEVFFMYGTEPESDSRKQVLDARIVLVPFSYSSAEITNPNRITDMNPHLSDIVQQYQIDCLVTAGPGYSHYPWNMIRNIPIVLLNIFGAPTLQRNIKTVIYNSQTTKKHAAKWIGEDMRAVVQFAPLLTAPPDNVRTIGHTLRSQLGIHATDFVFGRIGRADDGIFDPIGIRAWQKIAIKHPDAHYIIMSPPPALIKIVKDENIPRVHLLPPSNLENDVWAFHGALDAMAHFRFDGETSGVAIAESLFVGNPIVSHYSHIWNAHTEYLTAEISRIAPKNDSTAYAAAMSEFINIRNNLTATWNEMQKKATIVAEKNFSPNAYQKMTKDIIAKILT